MKRRHTAAVALTAGALIAANPIAASAVDEDPAGTPQTKAVQAANLESGALAAAAKHNRKANALVTGVLRNVRLTKAGKSYSLTYSADQLVYSRDRPDRTDRVVRLHQLNNRSGWRQLFGDKAPTMEATIAGRKKLVTVKLRTPKSLGGQRYRSRLSFPTDDKFRRGKLKGRNLAVFANAAPDQKPPADACTDAPNTTNFVPNNSDFIGTFGRTTVESQPGKKYLLLKSQRPKNFNWFLSQNNACLAKFTRAVSFNQMAKKVQWIKNFGRIKPNSSLMWQVGSKTQVLEFEQSRPRLNKKTGEWVSRIQPLADTKQSARQRVRDFVRTYGQEVQASSAYLFVDSTNSVNNGGEVFYINKDFEIRYSAVGTKMILDFSMSNNQNGWMGLTFHEFMFPGDSIIAWWDEAQGQGVCLDDYNPGIPTLPSFPAPLQDTNPDITIPDGSPLDNKDNVSLGASSRKNGTVTVTCERDLVTGDIFDFQITEGLDFPVVAAYNSNQDWINQYDAQQPMHTGTGSDIWRF